MITELSQTITRREPRLTLHGRGSFTRRTDRTEEAAVVAGDTGNRIDSQDMFGGEVPPEVLRFFEQADPPHEVRAFIRETINEMRSEEARQAQFVSDVSHEIRTPLTAIRGAAETLLEGDVPEQMQQRFLDQIIKECDRLTRLANDLLTLQRAEGENMELTRINLRAIADNCALLMQGLVEERGVNLTVVGEAPDVMGNADALNQILVNLIENASRFAGEGGHVRVEITCNEGHSVIAVKDDGPASATSHPSISSIASIVPTRVARASKAAATAAWGLPSSRRLPRRWAAPCKRPIWLVTARSSSSPFPACLPRTGRTPRLARI